MAEYAIRSRKAEETLACHKDLRWGGHPDETLDFFPAPSKNSPLLVFIHGGYWQELSKNESLFPAPDCVANGIAFASINYTLAPRAGVEKIVDQCRRAVAWLHRQGDALGFDRQPDFYFRQLSRRAFGGHDVVEGMANNGGPFGPCRRGRGFTQRNLRSGTLGRNVHFETVEPYSRRRTRPQPHEFGIGSPGARHRGVGRKRDERIQAPKQKLRFAIARCGLSGFGV